MLSSYCLSPFDPVQIIQGESVDTELADDDEKEWFKDKQLWSVLMFAVYFNQTAVVDELLTCEEYSDLLNSLAIQVCPKNN